MNQKRKPRLSDIELIFIDLTSIYMSINSEYQLFIVLPNSLKTRIERSVYNRRKRALFYNRESFRKVLANKISTQDYFTINSMLLEVCKLRKIHVLPSVRKIIKLLHPRVITHLNRLTTTAINFMQFIQLMAFSLIFI